MSLNGVKADADAGVEIGKVFGGYFSDNKPIADFIHYGVEPILEKLPTDIVLADFGGGEGALIQGVKSFLEQKGKRVKAYVIDANDSYLEHESSPDITKIKADLVKYSFPSGYDLIIMRSVLHYNQEAEQQRIVKNIRISLKQGGYFISAPSTGSSPNCLLRNEIVNSELLLPSGGRRTHKWLSLNEHIELVRKAGFQGGTIDGYAPEGGWTLTEMWNRFNTEKADQQRKEAFFTASTDAINRYVQKYDEDILGLEKTCADYRIHYQYPIIRFHT